jgi:hypothetical protein
MPAIAECPFIWKEGAAYPAQDAMRQPVGMRRSLAHDGRADPFPFHLDASIVAYGGRYYLSWYNSTDAEICGASMIRARVSNDAVRWSEPFTIVGDASRQDEHYVPSNFFEHEGRLYAIITRMSGKNMTVSLNLFARRPGEAESWMFVSRIADGFICNAPPLKLPDGNWIVGGWTPMKNETPAFPVVLISRGGSIEEEWRPRFLYDPLAPDAVRIRCPETAVHTRGDNVLVHVRNDEGPAYIFESVDRGLHWSRPMFSPMPINASKMFAGELSSGKRYLVYNAQRGPFVRTMLVIATTDPGERAFSRVYRVFEGVDEVLRRGSTWFYPCACEKDGFLHIACTLQEPSDVRSVALASIPIGSL